MGEKSTSGARKIAALTEKGRGQSRPIAPPTAASSTVEDYVKCIYKKQLTSESALVSTGQIATALGVSPGSVTTMVKTLAASDLVTYAPYSGVRLTPEGTRLATHVLRRHRVVELFLVEVMGMCWSEVHKDAEILEHAVSDRLIERMDEMLGRPQVDPHGDPIPNAAGAIVETDDPTLLVCPAGAALRVTRVLDQSAGFLRLLETHSLVPGSLFTVESRDEAAETVAIRAQDGSLFSLGFGAAEKVLVRPEASR